MEFCFIYFCNAKGKLEQIKTKMELNDRRNAIIKKQNEKKVRNFMENDLENIAKHVRRNKRLEHSVVMVGATLLILKDYCMTVNAAGSLDKLHSGGNTIFGVFKELFYWATLIYFIIDVIRCLSEGETKQIGKLVIRYAVCYGSVYFFPWILDLIRGL